MGTSELTTAEITFNGAVAYPVGPLDRGVANVVGIVLTYSRLTVGLSAAAFMTRAVREAKRYAEFRDAFGLQDRSVSHAGGPDPAHRRARRGPPQRPSSSTGISSASRAGSKAAWSQTKPKLMKKKRFAVRELIMLQKMAASWDCTDSSGLAMSVFGGHGVMEDFSSLPRLFRDSAINELWEGPRNVLLTQIHRDFQRASSWYAPAEFVRNILAGADEEIVKKLGAEMEELVAHPNLFIMDETTLDVCRRWDSFCHELYHAYQDSALREVGDSVS